MDPLIFVTLVESDAERDAACLLVRSIRAFGGDLCCNPIWLFADDRRVRWDAACAVNDLQVIPLDVPEPLRRYPFGSKVFAAAWAEELTAESIQSLVWIDPACLVVQPPLGYQLGEQADAALRPVHIQNVGLHPGDPLDLFWQGVYAVVGGASSGLTVESFVDQACLRAYFNSHAFAVRPRLGLLQFWLALFERLVADSAFQDAACRHPLHRTFLHQAVLSALLASRLPPDRLRILPPSYNYPYHLQSSIPIERREGVMNNLVTFAYEEGTLNPALMNDIAVRPPLLAWLDTGGGMPPAGKKDRV